MSKIVPAVNLAVREDLDKKDSSINKAAKVICKSPRQLGRELRGENKDGIVSLNTLAGLKRAELIEEETVQSWWDSARQVWQFKQTEPEKEREPLIAAR